MTDKCREEFEKWLTSTIDCKFEYDPVAGYLPQEVYQLYQAWQAAWEASRQCMTTSDI